MRPLTLILPYYRNPGMLERQQQVWRDYAPELKAHLHVIVVDDGSPKYKALKTVEPTGIATFRLYRTLVDVRWNWIFCRNLGVESAAGRLNGAPATSDWILLTDIDHVLPQPTLRRLLEGELDEDYIYRFSRVDAPDLTSYKPHPNTWLMTWQMFDRVGGYDEYFSGWYGSDSEFRDRCQAASRAMVMLPEVMIRYPREVIADASTTTYARKTPEDRENMRRLKQERIFTSGYQIKRLTFPWEHQLTILAGDPERAA